MEIEKVRLLLMQIIKTQNSFKSKVQAQLNTMNLDITFEMLQVLVKLWKEDGINQQELSRRLLKDKSSLSYVLNNLEKRKLIIRKEDSSDKRNKLLILTDKGLDLKDIFDPAMNNIYKDLSLELNESDVDYMYTELEKIDDIINNLK
ncbi:MAG: MarR family winged helix-turn-helix transcriptional regulator [Bacteroidales bacterium]